MTGRTTAPLRVLMVTPRFFPDTGGVEMHVYEAGRRLARAGIDLTVLATDVSGRLAPAEDVEGIRVRRVRAWPAQADYYLAPAIPRVIAEGGWDLVHCQSYHNFVAPLGMFGARRAGLPYLVSFHSGGHSSRVRTLMRGAQRAMLRPLLAGAARLVAVSRFERDFFRGALRLPGERFVVIPNGSSLPAAPDGAADAPGTLIVSVGRLERYKGHRRVLAALPLIRERRPDARLRIVGGGPDEPTLRRMARELGVEEHVEIGPIPAGDRAGMAALLRSASLVALLSDYEAHPIAVLEALAMGRPVLVTDTSGLRELASDGYARSIPLSSGPRQVALAALAEMRHPTRPATLRLPSWDDCADALHGLYRTVVSEAAMQRAAISREAACAS